MRSSSAEARSSNPSSVSRSLRLGGIGSLAEEFERKSRAPRHMPLRSWRARRPSGEAGLVHRRDAAGQERNRTAALVAAATRAAAGIRGPVRGGLALAATSRPRKAPRIVGERPHSSDSARAARGVARAKTRRGRSAAPGASQRPSGREASAIAATGEPWGASSARTRAAGKGSSPDGATGGRPATARRAAGRTHRRRSRG